MCIAVGEKVVVRLSAPLGALAFLFFGILPQVALQFSSNSNASSSHLLTQRRKKKSAWQNQALGYAELIYQG
jgi:hypothetical protein